MTDLLASWNYQLNYTKSTITLFFTLIHFSLFGIIFAQETIQQRFSPPPGYTRISVEPNRFAAWIQNLPLKEPGSPVLDFRGREFKKSNDSTVAAVVDRNIKGRRLEQCMDILLRFYSNYLIERGQRDSVQFPLPDGLILSWEHWREGWRPYFKGLHFRLKKSAVSDSSAKNFRRYLNTIFSYSGSQTFFHHYPDISPDKLQIGDFIVRKENKGHAVLIIDMVKNAQGQKMVLVGQGDTPACQFFILKGKNGSPWFPVNTELNYLPLPIKKRMFWKGLRRFPVYSD